MQAPETTLYPLGEPFIGTPTFGTPVPRRGQPWLWVGLACLVIITLAALGFLLLSVAVVVPAAR